MTEDPQVGQHAVQSRGRAIDGHHHPRRPAAGEKRGKRARQDDRSRTEDQHVVVRDLLDDHVRIVARVVKVSVGQGGREQEQRNGGQGDPDSLPDDRPDLPRAAGAFILGHERVDIGRHAQRKADQRELQHRRGHGRRHGVDRVPGQEHPVDERHHRERHGGNDQGQGQGHHVATAAGTAPPIMNLSEVCNVHQFFSAYSEQSPAILQGDADRGRANRQGLLEILELVAGLLAGPNKATGEHVAGQSPGLHHGHGRSTKPPSISLIVCSAALIWSGSRSSARAARTVSRATTSPMKIGSMKMGV